MPRLLRDLDQQPIPSKDATERGPSTPKTEEHADRRSSLTLTVELTGSIHSPYKLVKRSAYESLSDEDLQRLIRYRNVLAELISAASTADTVNDVSSFIPQSAVQEPPIRPSFAPDNRGTSNKLHNTLIQKLQEYIRMDRGLPPLPTEPVKPKINLIRRLPRITPRMNLTQSLRYQLVKKTLRPTVSSEPSPVRVREVSYKEDTAIKFNKLFVLRYLHNQGKPVMPASLEKFYWNYKKLPFRMVKKTDVPKRYLLPSIPENMVSFYGVETEQPNPFSELDVQQKKEEAEKGPAREKARPPLKQAHYRPPKRKSSSTKSKKKRWNHGTYRCSQRISVR